MGHFLKTVARVGAILGSLESLLLGRFIRCGGKKIELILSIMIDVIKKAMLAGVGAATLTKEKAEDALSDLVEKGKLSASDAKETAKKIADDGKQEFETATERVHEKFNELIGKLGRDHAKRIEELETKVAELEKRLTETGPSDGGTENS